MKIQLLFVFLILSATVFCQKKSAKNFENNLTEIEISAVGLDNLSLENSTSKYIEIVLFAENMNQQEIIISEENNMVSIKFQLDSLVIEESVFRKFITKRLQRAYAIVKVPKGKNVTIFGENHSIVSENFLGELAIFIEKGILKLNEIQSNTSVKMYAGTIHAVAKNTNITLHSNIGNITVDSILYQKDFQKKVVNSSKNMNVNTVKGIISITTQ